MALHLIKKSKKPKLQNILGVGDSVREALHFKRESSNDQPFVVMSVYSSLLKI